MLYLRFLDRLPQVWLAPLQEPHLAEVITGAAQWRLCVLVASRPADRLVPGA